MKRRSRSEIRRILSLRTRERLSYQALSRRTGVPASTLASWEARERRDVDTVGFAEVVISEDGHSADSTGVELIVSEDVRIAIDRSFDPGILRRVLDVLVGRC